MRGGRLAGCDGDGFRAAVGEGGGDEDGCETTDAADERGTGETPVFAADVVVVDVSTSVGCDAEEYEDLMQLALHCSIAVAYDTYNDSNDFQETEPVFKLSLISYDTL